MAFTRKKMTKYPLLLSGWPLTYVRPQPFLGIVIDRSLPQVKKLRARIAAASELFKFMVGTQWGCKCRSMVLLEKAYIEGTLHYCLPVLHRLSPTNKRTLEGARNNCLRICLGLPKSSSGSGTVAEAGCLPLDVICTQEILRTHFRHVIHGKKQFLYRIHLTHSNSAFVGVQMQQLTAIRQPKKLMPRIFPPWTLTSLDIKQCVPGINEVKRRIAQTALLQTTLFCLAQHYTQHSHIYTDASTTQKISSYGLYVPSTGQSLSHRLQRRTSSTAELHGIKEAVLYILRQMPNQ